MGNFFRNHDWVEISDFFLAGAFAVQLSFLPEFFISSALKVQLPRERDVAANVDENETANTMTLSMLLICRFAGLFLCSERLAFYHMLRCGDLNYKHVCTTLSLCVWSCSAYLFITRMELFHEEFWQANVGLQMVAISLFAFKFIRELKQHWICISCDTRNEFSSNKCSCCTFYKDKQSCEVDRGRSSGGKLKSILKWGGVDGLASPCPPRGGGCGGRGGDNVATQAKQRSLSPSRGRTATTAKQEREKDSVVHVATWRYDESKTEIKTEADAEVTHQAVAKKVAAGKKKVEVAAPRSKKAITASVPKEAAVVEATARVTRTSSRTRNK